LSDHRRTVVSSMSSTVVGLRTRRTLPTRPIGDLPG